MRKIVAAIAVVLCCSAHAQEDPATDADKAQAQELFKGIVEAGQAEIVAKAKKHGCKAVVFGHGLMQLAENLKRGIDTIDQIKKIAIETGGEDGMGESLDDKIRAFQVIDEHTALYSSYEGTVFLLQHSKKPIMEHSPLPVVADYVVVVGTRVYKTIMGSRQAIVIEPAF
jgi:hypothetical protein